ncbi:hypothetical protein [uncultured Piscinibacter sp.]|uniref:hypothetical protein n=1 Tax=uncultured Piscinibacter sp. TaxID=1131835 RepID=UPI0026213D4C|nr:hypothetical protein [uncultured Piscinibacter sp.]
MKINETRPASDAPARVLALMMVANGHIDPRELEILEELDAFERIGVPRERFVALAQDCLREVGSGLAECSWLRARDQAYVDRLLDAVTDPQMRLVLCRLAAATITADGCVSGEERLVYEHVLARWHISRAMVTQAILSHVERRP